MTPEREAEIRNLVRVFGNAEREGHPTFSGSALTDAMAEVDHLRAELQKANDRLNLWCRGEISLPRWDLVP